MKTFCVSFVIMNTLAIDKSSELKKIFILLAYLQEIFEVVENRKKKPKKNPFHMWVQIIEN